MARVILYLARLSRRRPDPLPGPRNRASYGETSAEEQFAPLHRRPRRPLRWYVNDSVGKNKY
jgi:hypothetical protein